MTCRPAAWRPLEWVLRSAHERLVNASPQVDLAFFRELLGKIADTVGSDAPADVVEALARLEHAVMERERIQARAERVRDGSQSSESTR